MSAKSQPSVAPPVPSPAVPVGPAPDEVLSMIEGIKSLAAELRAFGSENKKLDKIKGNEELMHRIDEVLVEIEEQSDKLLAASASQSVQRDLKAVEVAMLEVKEFFSAVSRLSMFTSKQRLRLRMQNIYQTLRARCTQLMTAVSLELLTRKPAEERPVPIASELFKAGLFHYYGICGRAKNFTLAFEKFNESAQFGDADGMVMVARCYQEGHGVDVSGTMALHWLERAAVIGAPHAKTSLAQTIVAKLKAINPRTIKDHFLETPTSNGLPSMHDDGNEDAKSAFSVGEDEEHRDVQFAVKLLLEAAGDGHAEAKTVLGELFEEAGDITQACKWFSLASNSGCSRATYLLADILFHAQGAGNHSQRAKAFSLYAMAARNGHAEAEYGLGLCHEIGLGCEPSVRMAMEHYAVAARAGSAMGMYSLGYVCVKDGIEAREALRALAERSEVAYAALAERMDRMLAEGIRWLRAAMELKVADAAFQLGRLYDQGIGLPEDHHAAGQCYEVAADLDHPKAALYAANIFYERGERRQAGAYYKRACCPELPSAYNCYALMLEEGQVEDTDLPAGPQANVQRVLLAAAYYLAAARCHELPAVYNLLLLAYTHNLQSFVDLEGRVVQVAALLPTLHELRDEDDDAERGRALQALLEAVERDSRAALGGVEGDNSASTGRPPLFHHHAQPYFPSQPRPAASGAWPEYKQQESADLVLFKGGARASLRAPSPAAPSTVQDLWQVSVLSHVSPSAYAAPSSLSFRLSEPERRAPEHSFSAAHSSSAPAPGPAPGPRGVSLSRAGEVYVTTQAIVPPNYVPKAVMQSVPLSAADKKPNSKSAVHGPSSPSRLPPPPQDLHVRALPPLPLQAKQPPAAAAETLPSPLARSSSGASFASVGSAPPAAAPLRPRTINLSESAPDKSPDSKKPSLWAKLMPRPKSTAMVMTPASVAQPADASPRAPTLR